MCSVKLTKRSLFCGITKYNFTRNPGYDTSDYSTNHLTFREGSFMLLIK